MRFLIIILTLILVTARAAAQDMALSQILIDGEGWKQTPRDSAVFPRIDPAVPPGFENPTCSVMSPDHGTLFVGSDVGKYVWAFRVGKGDYDAGQPYCSLRVPRGQKDMPVTSLCVDNAGRIYAATPLGVQIFDPTGRLSGVLSKPSSEPILLVNLIGDSLYVATEHATYVRKVKARSIEKPK